MKIKIKARHLALTSELKNYVKRRILFALDSRRENIKRIEVTLSDINGPKGGEDKRCQVLVKLNGQQDVIINDKQVQIFSAIDKAADRASRSVSKRIERLQHKATRIKSVFRKVRPQKSEKPDIYEEYENEYGYFEHA
ncbi:HPF/RaiA family ribosome-associated protein [Marinicellulosiphila megalodicopiae]|uniref:HPF/RaiA family ribosome-associated protein n=1 Tax=Marinicellulosiphila megalodicopiae TaxID=2724896 RepID=UPI003BAF102F